MVKFVQLFNDGSEGAKLCSIFRAQTASQPASYFLFPKHWAPCWRVPIFTFSARDLWLVEYVLLRRFWRLAAVRRHISSPNYGNLARSLGERGVSETSQ